MRSMVVLASMVLVVGTLAAQDDQRADPEPATTTPANVENLVLHGEFAVLLLKVVWTEGPLPPADEALRRVQDLELVPGEWGVFGFLRHGELADVLQKFGAVYVPAEDDEYATRPFVEALLRRELDKLRDYLATRMGHGFSLSHVMDEGVDRAVSPSEFQ